MIFTHERIQREYAHMRKTEPHDKAIEWTAARLGLPGSIVEKSVTKIEENNHDTISQA